MTKWKDKDAAIRSLERSGKVNPNDLIAAARSPEHPCHGDFTWDIEHAAEERWRDQARSIIRRCKFEVLVDEEITERVVRYVESPDDEPVFISLPKMRSVAKTSAVLARELTMLHGNASRVYGIALAKSDIVGADTVRNLGDIRDQLKAMITDE